MDFKTEQLILDFGLAKTGTSAIQHALFSQRNILLRNENTLYPGRYENHYYFQAMFSKNPGNLLQIQMLGYKDRIDYSGFLEKYREEVLDEIQETQPRRIIISSEYFSGMNLKELKEFRKFLESIAKEIILFAYVRDPWTFSTSYIQERIKAGSLTGTVTINYMLGNVELIDKFENAFGSRAVIVPYVNYPKKFNSVDDFCKRFSLHTLCTDDQKYMDVNKSMYYESACMLLELNRLYPQFDKRKVYVDDPARDWMAESLQNPKILGKPIYISTKTAQRIFKECKTDIDLMEKKYFNGLKPFTEYYKKLKTTNSDDSLDISKLKPRQLSELFLTSLRYLSERAIYYYENNKALLTRLTESDKRNSFLESQLAERDNLISSLVLQGDERGNKLSSLEAHIVEREQTMTSLEVQLSDKDHQVQDLSNELSEIKASKAWKLALFFRNVRLFLIPVNSKREELIRRLISK